MVQCVKHYFNQLLKGAVKWDGNFQMMRSIIAIDAVNTEIVTCISPLMSMAYAATKQDLTMAQPTFVTIV